MLAQGKVPDGRYKLINRKTGKTIEVENHGRDDGHKLQTNAYSGGGSQHWHIIPQEGGYYLLVGVESSKAINVPKSVSDDGVPLEQANVNKGPSQK
ncbi:MAG: RICIN domain-containing protein [Chthoniobacter sp.]